jgi:hypothetical protein
LKIQKNYEWSTVQQLVRSIRGTYEKRPQGEYGAQKKLRELLKSDIQLREVPDDQAERILRNLHTYDRSTAEQLHQDLQNKPRRSGISFVDGEIVFDPTLPIPQLRELLEPVKKKILEIQIHDYLARPRVSTHYISNRPGRP